MKFTYTAIIERRQNKFVIRGSDDKEHELPASVALLLLDRVCLAPNGARALVAWTIDKLAPRFFIEDDGYRLRMRDTKEPGSAVENCSITIADRSTAFKAAISAAFKAECARLNEEDNKCQIAVTLHG